MTTVQTIRTLGALAALAAADDAGVMQAIGAQAYELLLQSADQIRKRHLGESDSYSYGCSICEALRAADVLLAEIEP